MWTFINSYWKKVVRRRRPFKLTRGGWVFILYTIGVGAGAINTGNNLLYLVFGLFLGIILASGLFSDLSLWGVRATLLFPAVGTAHQPNLWGFQITNQKKWMPSFSLSIEVEGKLKGKSIVIRKFIPILFPHEPTHQSFVVRPPSRGEFVAEKIRFSTRFPFGLIYKWWTFQLNESEDRHIPHVVIYPNTMPISSELLVIRTLGDEKESQLNRRGDGTSVYSLRDYQVSDNPKKIHWKTSAKRSGGEWLVREMEMDEKNDLVLWWPSLKDISAFSHDEVEALIDFTASIVLSNDLEGKTIQMCLPEGRVKDIMMFLALFNEVDPTSRQNKNHLEPDSGDIDIAGFHTNINVYQSYLNWKRGREAVA